MPCLQAQREPDRHSGAGRESGPADLSREVHGGFPDGIEREVERELGHRTGTLEGKVVIEEILLATAREDVRKRVLEEVDDLTVVERRIRREPAPPAQRGRVSEAVLVDAGQIAFNERVPPSGLEIDSLQPLEPKPLSEADDGTIRALEGSGPPCQRRS